LYPDRVPRSDVSRTVIRVNFQIADEQDAFRKRYGVTEDYRFRSSGHDKPVALSSKGTM
jgi:hypothetical protein